MKKLYSIIAVAMVLASGFAAFADTSTFALWQYRNFYDYNTEMYREVWCPYTDIFNKDSHFDLVFDYLRDNDGNKIVDEETGQPLLDYSYPIYIYCNNLRISDFNGLQNALDKNPPCFTFGKAKPAPKATVSLSGRKLSINWERDDWSDMSGVLVNPFIGVKEWFNYTDQSYLGLLNFGSNANRFHVWPEKMHYGNWIETAFREVKLNIVSFDKELTPKVISFCIPQDGLDFKNGEEAFFCNYHLFTELSEPWQPENPILLAEEDLEKFTSDEIINYLNSILYSQYFVNTKYSNYIINGEPFMNTFYGEVPGSDAYYYRWKISGLENEIINHSGLYMDEKEYCYFPFLYYAAMIKNSTTILGTIEERGWKEMDMAKSQLHALRGYGYLRLMQLFGPRWEDSKDGEARCLPLVKNLTPEDMTLASASQIMDFIYSEFDKSLELQQGQPAPKEILYRYLNQDAVRALYSRAAMLSHDWAKAQEMAALSRANHPLLTEENYIEGISLRNDNWIWGLQSNSSPSKKPGNGFAGIYSIYYWTWGAFYACNGTYPRYWGNIGSGAINYSLFKKMQENDFRRKLFFTPDSELITLNKSQFWSSQIVDAESMDMSKNYMVKTNAKIIGINLKPSCIENIPDAYASKEEMIPFGAQYKFWSYDDYGSSDYPMIRAEEMLLTEAEASCMLGDSQRALSLLNELNAKRISGYEPISTTNHLLEEIKLARRLELWGEGHNWFDLKRWNEPLVREAWVEGDENSNNIPAKSAIRVEASDYNGWRLPIPAVMFQQPANSNVPASQSAEPVTQKELLQSPTMITEIMAN